MNYIVFDLEWNQCPYGKKMENEKIPFEIVEIGAVKLNEERQIIDQYQTLIQPRVYRKLHFRTKEIIGLSMKELETGSAFYKAIREFLKWCGEDYCFCTWGGTDLLELQRNMKYYGVLNLLQGPIFFLDVQKLFSLDKEDGDSRKALEYAVDYLQIEKQQVFHRALTDAWYTGMVFSHISAECAKTYYSIDCYQNPKTEEAEIRVVYPNYSKYISREFVDREEAMKDREMNSTKCFLCGKNAHKKLRWFSGGGKNYYCLAKCSTHGWIKGKIRMKKAEDGNIFVVKTLKLVHKEEAEEIREKKEEIKKRRRKKK